MNPRRHDRLTVAAFLAALALPAVCQFAGWDLPGDARDEKRNPVPFPAVPATGADWRAFPRRVDDWFRDHFGLRRLLIRSHAVLLHRGLHTSPQPKILLGRDGWLFYDGARGQDGDPVADARGTDPIPPLALEQWRWMLQDLHDWFAARGASFLPVFVPAKELVYGEALPRWMAPVADAAAIDRLCGHLARHTELGALNLRPVLAGAKAEDRLFLKTDTHWNELGAYHGYLAIFDALAQRDGRLRPLPQEAFVVEKQRGEGGDLAGMAGLRHDLQEEYTFLRPAAPRRAEVRKLGDYEQADAASRIAGANLPRALVLRDSFSNALIPFFAEHFSTALYRWPTAGIDYETLERTPADVVIAVFGDRHLRQPFRYPARIQADLARRRFEAAPEGTHYAAADIAAWTAGDGLSVGRHTDGVVLRTGRDGEGWLALPPVPGASETLPLVRVEVTARRDGDLQLQWASARAGYIREHRVSAPMPAGRSTVCLPLLDPEMAGPVRLRFPRTAGPLVVHGIEIRALPR